jgi:hypothetical protein
MAHAGMSDSRQKQKSVPAPVQREAKTLSDQAFMAVTVGFEPKQEHLSYVHNRPASLSFRET